jgi:hypothetical protein
MSLGEVVSWVFGAVGALFGLIQWRQQRRQAALMAHGFDRLAARVGHLDAKDATALEVTIWRECIASYLWPTAPRYTQILLRHAFPILLRVFDTMEDPPDGAVREAVQRVGDHLDALEGNAR